MQVALLGEALKQYGRTLGVVCFDAHGDMHTEKTTPSGNLHGVPYASMFGLGPPELREHLRKEDGSYYTFSGSQLLFIGGNSWEDEEIALANKRGVTRVMMNDIRTNERVAADTLREFIARHEHIVVEFDLDGLDRKYAPAVMYPNDNGLALSLVGKLCAMIYRSNKLVGVEVSEYVRTKDKPITHGPLEGHMKTGLAARYIAQMLFLGNSAASLLEEAYA